MLTHARVRAIGLRRVSPREDAAVTRTSLPLAAAAVVVLAVTNAVRAEPDPSPAGGAAAAIAVPACFADCGARRVKTTGGLCVPSDPPLQRAAALPLAVAKAFGGAESSAPAPPAVAGDERECLRVA